jgi:hypothetical protein
MFELGVSYTREQIHAQLGRSLQSYLPHVGGRVVAACLRLDTNPDAPAVILVGMGDGIEHAAELFGESLRARSQGSGGLHQVLQANVRGVRVQIRCRVWLTR